MVQPSASDRAYTARYRSLQPFLGSLDALGRKAAATCDAPNNRSARLALPQKPGAAATLAIPGANPPQQRAWGRGRHERGAAHLQFLVVL